MIHLLELAVLFTLFSSLLAVAIGTWLEDNSACDELPMQHLRSTPEPPVVRTFTFFDQDAVV